MPGMKKGGKLFKGKETYSEELEEGKAIKSGKISPEQYAKGEKSEKKMATGGVAKGQGGYATGGVAKGQGGFKSGGSAAKKAFATGGAVDSGRPVAMPQGRKKPSEPISTNRFAGTFKDGGGVEELVDSSKGAYDRTVDEPPMGMGFAKKVHGVIDSLFAPKKEAGAGRGFINPPSVTKSKEWVTVTKKHGGLSK